MELADLSLRGGTEPGRTGSAARATPFYPVENGHNEASQLDLMAAQPQRDFVPPGNGAMGHDPEFFRMRCAVFMAAEGGLRCSSSPSPNC